MSSLLAAAAPFPAAVSFIATVAERGQRRKMSSALALVSFLAMADHAFHLSTLPAILWLAILVVTAMCSAALVSRSRSPLPSRARALCHEQLGLIVIGLVMVSDATHSQMDTAASHHAGGLELNLLAGWVTASFAVSTCISAVKHVGSRVSAISMGASMALMALALFC